MQALVRAAADSDAANRINVIVQQAVRAIAVVLFTREARPELAHRADASDIRRLGGEELLQSYEDDATLVMRMRDSQRHREAVYYAANAATPGGIGSLSIGERAVAIEQFEVGFRAYRDALTNRAHPDVTARLGRLLEADRAVTEAAATSTTKEGVH